MDAFLVFKFLHIASMFFAVALAVSSEIVVRRVAASGDPTAIRTTIERTKVLAGPIAGLLFVAGLVFGVITAITGQIDLLRPWLIATYVLFAGAFAISLGIVDPWAARLERATSAQAGEGGGATVAQVIDDPVARAGAWGLQAILVTIVFLMVVKPLG